MRVLANNIDLINLRNQLLENNKQILLALEDTGSIGILEIEK